MANFLTITKLTDIFFSFTLNGDTVNAVINSRNNVTIVGNFCHFKSDNGANLIKEQNILFSNVTIIDGATLPSPVSVDDLIIKLDSVNFFDWTNGTGGGSGVNRFDELVDTFEYFGKDGQSIRVNESQQKLEPFVLPDVSMLSNFPSPLIPLKSIRVNSLATAYEFYDTVNLVTQFIRSGYTETSPSEDILNQSLALKANISDIIDNKIEEWTVQTYEQNDLVKKLINDQTYLFSSTEDDNDTQPILNSAKEVWSLSPYGGTYIGTWSAGAYVTGNIVSRNNYIYYCLTNNSTDPELLVSPNWIKLGYDRGAFNGSFSGGYFNGDVVRDGSNIVYISNYSENTYALNYGILSKWELINGQPNTVICWGDSLTFGTGSSGIGNYPSQFYVASGINIDNKGVPGETSTQIKTRFLAEPDKWKYPTIIWAGRNNNGDPTTVKADIASMVEKIPHDRYLILGIIVATNESPTSIQSLNADLKAIYGDRFINMQDYLLTIYDPTIPQDVTDHGNNVIAWSLRSDWLHLNNLGYFYVAKAVSTRSNILVGKDKLFQNNIESGSVRVTGNTIPDQNTIGLELLYRSDINKSVIQSYNRVANTPITTSIGFSIGSTVELIQGGGQLDMGLVDSWTTGVAKPLVRTFDDHVLEFPVMDNDYIMKQDSSTGFYSSSQILDNGSEVSVDDPSPELGILFQVNGAVAFGANGSPRIYAGNLDANTSFIQSRDTTTAKILKFFALQYIFDKPITASDATVGTELATLNQVNSIASSASYTPTVTAGTNVTSATLGTSSYQKIGNIVTCSVAINLQATAINLVSEITITAPINRSGTVPNYYIGCGTYQSIDYFGSVNAFFSGSGTSVITLRFNSGSSVASAGSLVLIFQYDLTK